jgi:hypothetical protein
VTVGGVADSVSGVAADAAARTVTLSLTNAAAAGQVVSVSYADATVGNDLDAIQDVYGNDSGAFGPVAVTNITPALPGGITVTAPPGGGTIFGTLYGDFLYGQGGDDTIHPRGGDDLASGGGGLDTVVFTQTRGEYAISHTDQGYRVRLVADSANVVDVQDVERLRFSDMTVNLQIGDVAGTISTELVDDLVELYVAYIDRVPDADGMAFWIGQLRGGKTLQQLGEHFHAAAVAYPELTGYSAAMTNEDFVRAVYKEVLGRDTPDAEGLAFWSGLLADAVATRGALVGAIVDSAHTFKGDAQWGWVADLLDNKIEVGRKFAVEMGLLFNSPDDSISQGVLIADAVLPTDTTPAIELIGVNDGFIV